VDNALTIATWLESHPDVENVNYPGLASNPTNERARKYLRNGFGGVLSFELKGDSDRAASVINNLKLVSHLANVGDAKSLIIQPSLTTHQQLDATEQRAAGVTPNLLRLSVGIEHVDDIIDDLDQAIRRTQ
jgi:O-acetylhomoserine (thiol)-lyase